MSTADPNYQDGILTTGGSPPADAVPSGPEALGVPNVYGPTTRMADPIPAGRAIDPIAMVRRRWRLVVLGMALGIGLSVLYFQAATRRYQSSIEVLVGQRTSEMTQRGTISGSQAAAESIGEDQLATHMRLFIARKVLSRAIEKGDLQQFESFDEVARAGGSMVDHVLDNIEIERGGEGGAADAMVLRAIYNSDDPEESAMVLSAIFAAYQSYVDSQDRDDTKLAAELIEEARKTHERELHQADAAYRDAVALVPVLLEGSNNKEIHKERLVNIEAELTQVRSDLAESTSRLQVIEKALQSKVDDFGRLALLSQKEIERLRFFMEMNRGGSRSEAFQAEQPLRNEAARVHYTKLLELIQKEKTLSDNFGNGHPLVEAARREIQITRDFIRLNSPRAQTNPQTDLAPNEMVTTYVNLLRNDIAELKKRQEVLLSESRREMVLAKNVESELMKVESLRAARDRAQARYDQVIHRLQELNLSRSYAGFSTDLLAAPEVASKPVWPILPICLLLGCGGGLAFGLGLALTLETLDSTFSGVEDLEVAVGAPAIAHVPRMDARKMHQRALRHSALDPSLVTHHTPRGPEAEIYRVARTAMMIANRKGSARTVMVTSPQPGDGKSTTISNLAISIAQTGKRVLLIDADMRRPVISTLFGIQDRPGLSDVLNRRISLNDAIHPTEVTNLQIIPNGSDTSEPAELLESANLSRIIRSAADFYDLVMIDAPPVLAVADPAIIAPMVDSLLLTVRIVKNGRGIVQDAVRLLSDNDLRPTAVIVNGVESDCVKTYGYGHYGRNQYSYVGKYHNKYQAKQHSESYEPAEEMDAGESYLGHDSFGLEEDAEHVLVTETSPTHHSRQTNVRAENGQPIASPKSRRGLPERLQSVVPEAPPVIRSHPADSPGVTRRAKDSVVAPPPVVAPPNRQTP